MIKTATKYTPAPLPAVTGDPRAIFRQAPDDDTPTEYDSTRAAFEAAAAAIIATAAAVLFIITGSKSGQYITASPSTYAPGAIQLSYFDKFGAVMHETHATPAKAAAELPNQAQPAAAILF